MSRPKSDNKTPQNLQSALQAELSNNTLAGISAATKISISSLSQYSKGIGEPTSQTLQALADFFKVDIEYLRSEGIYKNLSGANRLEVARRFHADEREKAVFESFVVARMAEIEAGDKRSNKAHVGYCEDMERLKSEIEAERRELFSDLEAAFDAIPDLLKRDAILRLAEKLK